ncbi:MAG: phytanoyl-CoA dioxygenase family protein [Acidobacteriota bacterium]|nr:phytanoyl-CoA dioxygenase family protein [Acidobacteriota bacterium]
MSLTHLQRDYFHDTGYLAPLPLLSREEAEVYRQRADRTRQHLHGEDLVQPHLFFDWARELALLPRVLDAVESLIGADILVHSTSLFWKAPGDGVFVSWHQDGYYWRLSEPEVVSAWIALSVSNREAGCLQVIPGSQRDGVVLHTERRAPGNMLRSGLTVDLDVDPERAVAVELTSGQFSLHHVDLVHGSRPNTSDQARVGFAVRYIPAGVRQDFPHHEVIQARGVDDAGNYAHWDAEFNDEEEALRAHARFKKRLRTFRLGNNKEKA